MSHFRVGLCLLAGLCITIDACEQTQKTPLDSYNDPLPPGAITRIGTIRLRHGNVVTALAFSPDGKVLASGGMDQRVRFWDVATGKELGADHAHQHDITAIAYADGGKILVSADVEGNIFLWDALTRKVIRRLPGVHRN